MVVRKNQSDNGQVLCADFCLRQYAGIGSYYYACHGPRIQSSLSPGASVVGSWIRLCFSCTLADPYHLWYVKTKNSSYPDGLKIRSLSTHTRLQQNNLIGITNNSPRILRSYLPWNLGARFSTKAVDPSLWSSVSPQRACVIASRSKMVRKSECIARLMFSFM